MSNTSSRLVEVVDPPDELHVVRAPGRVGRTDGLVARHRLVRHGWSSAIGRATSRTGSVDLSAGRAQPAPGSTSVAASVGSGSRPGRPRPAASARLRPSRRPRPAHAPRSACASRWTQQPDRRDRAAAARPREQVVVAGPADASARAGAPSAGNVDERQRAAGRSPTASGSRRGRRRRCHAARIGQQRAPLGVGRVGLARASPAPAARCRPGRSCASIHWSALITTAGTTNPPRLGPSGPTIDRRVAGEHDPADGVGAVVDVATGAGRPRRRRSRAQPGVGPDQPDAGAVGAVVDASSSRRTAPRRRPSVRCSGAPCGPGDDPHVHSPDSAGSSGAHVERRAPVLRRPTRQHVARASARPSRPPNPPSRNVARLPSTARHVDPAGDGEVRAHARRRRSGPTSSTLPGGHDGRRLPAQADRRRPWRRRRRRRRRSAYAAAKRSSGPRSDRLQPGGAARRCPRRGWPARTTGRPRHPTAARRRPTARAGRRGPARSSACRARRPRPSATTSVAGSTSAVTAPTRSSWTGVGFAAVAGVVQLRAVADQDEQVALGPHLDVLARAPRRRRRRSAHRPR